MEMSGRTVFLTGASSGIGRGTARVFAEAGARVALCARSEDKLCSLAAEIGDAGGVAAAFPADVTDADALEAALQSAATHFGGIDIVVHCAGTNVKGKLTDMQDEDWDLILDTNLKSAYRLGQLAHPYLKEAGRTQPSKFLVIGSVGSYQGIPLSAAYCASKGGLVQLIRAMAVEWAGDNICVNAVCPGYIRTAMSEKAFRIGDTYNKVLSRIPMKRIGAPEDVGKALLFLASSSADYITGTTLNVDGGLLATAYTMDD